MSCAKKECLLNGTIERLELPVSFHAKTRASLVNAMKAAGHTNGESIALFKGDVTKPIQDQGKKIYISQPKTPFTQMFSTHFIRFPPIY